MRKALKGIYHCSNFRWKRCSKFDRMKVCIFCTFGLKIAIHAQQMGFGAFDQQNEVHYQRNPPKGTFLQGNTSYDV